MPYLMLAIPFILSAAICHYLANSRGANPRFWGVMGFVFGPLVIPFVFLAKGT